MDIWDINSLAWELDNKNRLELEKNEEELGYKI